MFTKSVFVTGCSRGMGLEWIKQLVNETDHLFAGCRSLSTAKELQAIADANKHVVVLEIDVTNDDSIGKAIEKISDVVGDDGLNCLINNAAVGYRINSFDDLTIHIVEKTHQTNVVGPIRIIKGCLPLLQKAATKSNNIPMGISRSAILNISSNFASLELTNSNVNLCYAYRLSKAALNMLTRTLSAEYKEKGILVVSIHPGWVRTDMGGYDASLSTVEAIKGMMNVASSLNEGKSGLYYGWDGSALPW